MEAYQTLTDLDGSRGTILIIGAGVAGCLLGTLLKDQFSVHILEKVAENDHLHFGTGLNIGPNAVKSLERADGRLAAKLEAVSLPWDSWRMMLCDDQILFDVKLRDIAGCSGWRISWSDLYSVLRAACDGIITYQCSDIKVDWHNDADSKASVSWSVPAEGSKTINDVDLIIAADGRYSSTRQSIAGPPKTMHLGVSIFRLLVEDTSGGLIDDHDQWFNGQNRLLAFRVNPNWVYIAGTFPIDATAEIEVECKSPEFLRKAYMPTDRRASPAVQWIIDAICLNSENIHWARMQEQEIRLREPNLPVLYLGDAGHGMIPTLGQGATQAIEDACVAARILLIGADTNEPLQQSMRQFEEQRLPRLNFAADFSTAASDTMLPGTDVIVDTKRKMEPEFLRRLALLYNDIGATADYAALSSS